MIPGLGRSPGEENGNPLQHSCLENPMNRGAWQATVHGVSGVGQDLGTRSLPASNKSYAKIISLISYIHTYSQMTYRPLP